MFFRYGNAPSLYEFGKGVVDTGHGRDRLPQAYPASGVGDGVIAHGRRHVLFMPLMEKLTMRLISSRQTMPGIGRKSESRG